MLVLADAFLSESTDVDLISPTIVVFCSEAYSREKITIISTAAS